MKKKAHIQNDDNIHIIKPDDDFEEVSIEFIGDTLWLGQMNGFSTDPLSEVCLSRTQAKELFRILGQKYLVRG